MIRSITVGRPTLDDVFVQRTGHRLRDGARGETAEVDEPADG
jgi:hypothetical protein